MMNYIVKKIEEDLDFGCEERTADEPVMAVVTLEDISGAKQVIRMEDALLYKRDIREGMEVRFDAEGRLERIYAEGSDAYDRDQYEIRSSYSYNR